MADIRTLTQDSLAAMLEHTIIGHPEYPDEVYLEGAQVALEHGFGAYYVPNTRVELVNRVYGKELKERHVELGCGNSGGGVIMSGHTPETKLREIEYNLKNGATACDQVLAIYALKNKDYKLVERELREGAELAHSGGAKLKVLLETGYLTDDEIVLGTMLVANAGADYVKTSMGVGPVGKTNLFQVGLIMDTLTSMKTSCKLKATNGMLENVFYYIQAGASRCGSNNAILALKALPLVQKMMFN